MGSIFNALHIGYSGLNAAQAAIETTGHNISNSETAGYSRQRVVTTAAMTANSTFGSLGNGTQVAQIARIFDQFVFDRYTKTAQNKENSDTLKSNLQELSTYFPDIQNVGIKHDLQSYFDSWQSFSNNPSNTALKVDLAQKTQTLSDHINQTRSQISGLQDSVNTQLGVNIDEVNRIGSQIANINKSINQAEAGGGNNANDLRDQRSQLELSMSKLIGSKVMTGQIQTNNAIDSNIAIENGSYTIQAGGFNIVDGATFHPIGMDSTKNPSGYNDLYYERQDGVKIPMATSITGGKVGALLELRGSNIGSDGVLQDGFLQETLNNMDTFAKGLIESTNSIYAQSATDKMDSNLLSFTDTQSLLGSGENFKAGTFNVVTYDISGKETARRAITINASTVMDNADSTNLLPNGTPNSIVGQLKALKDDNSDNNALNDIGNILTPSFSTSPNVLSLSVSNAFASQGITFAIEDNGTNFAGVTGINRFLDGSGAKDIALNLSLESDQTQIKGYKSPANGDGQLALDMVGLQFNSIDFKSGLTTNSDTAYGYFDSLVTKVGTKTNAVISNNDAITAQFNAIQQEQDSVSKVNIDEEMANLIRYQTSYGAAAKVISTIDQMMTTLLGIKS
ncbi:MAG: flagellar hook-associated protein FlgK [Campylobacterales bacterium]|nr:flagellar hook-associated protein FlgK [Campylobacterales bacterium]